MTKLSGYVTGFTTLQRPKRLIVVCLALLMLLAFSGYVIFNEPSKQRQFNVFQSPHIELTIEQVTKADADFQSVKNDYVNLGSREALWLKITGVDADQILVVERNSVKTAAQLYYQNKSQIKSQNNEWQQRALHGTAQFHNHFVTNLPKEMANGLIYLKLNGQYLRGTVSLYDHESFFYYLQNSALYNGLYYGMLMLFIVYNLMLYIRLKITSYLAYSALLSVLLLWFLSGQGWLTFLFSGSAFAERNTVALGLLLAITNAEFAKQYLQIRTLSEPLYKGLSILQWMLAGFLLVKLTVAGALPQQVYYIGYGIGLVTAILLVSGCFAGGLIGVKKGNTAAWYYVVATVFFFIMVILMGLSAGNIINLPFSWRFLQMASVVEVVIFSAGLVSIVHQQRQQQLKTEAQLAKVQADFVTQLQISNDLKDNIMSTVVDPKLIPQLAKITNLLSDIHYVQASGNWCQVNYQKGNQTRQIELECNLQNLMDSFEQSHFLRVHKSYLVNPQQPFVLQRRTSADYDLNILGALIPVGRKYLGEVKALV